MQDKPRICIVIPAFHPWVGGAETQTLAQCQKLREAGYQVQVVTFRHDAHWPTRECVVGDVPVRRVAGLFMSRRAKMSRFWQKLMYFFALIVMSWTVWMERSKYDVLQVCLLSKLVLPLAVVCWLARKPMLVILISAGDKRQSRGKLLSGPLDPDIPWLEVEERYRATGDVAVLRSSGKMLFKLTRYLLSKMKARLVVLSKRMLLDLQENDFYLPGTRCIANGVDIVHYQPIAADLAEDEQRRKTVVCVSRLSHEKGVDVLLQAWQLVMQNAPVGSRLLLVGDGSLRGKLEQLASALHIAESIEFLGERYDIADQIHRGMISVLPSRLEGMPNALLEAMACGNACVATGVSGSEDLIDHQVNGLLVAVEDYEAMAQAILTLLQDSSLAARYGLAARRTVEEHYALERIVHAYINLYHEMTGKDAQLCVA